MNRQRQIGRPEADPVLGSLLTAWPAPEVSGAFEANVLRAIRRGELSIPEPSVWQVFMPSNVRVVAGVTLAVLLAAGAFTGVLAGRTATRERMASHPVYRQQTLTGAYLVASTSRRAP